MNLEFIGREAQAGAIDASAPDRLFVAPDELTRELVQDGGGRAVLLNDSIWEVGAGNPVKDFCCDAAQAWYKDEAGQDYTLYRGVSLGAVIEAILWEDLLVPIYKFAYFARRLIDSEKSVVVRADASLSAHRRAVLDALCEAAGVRFETAAVDASPADSLPFRRLNWPLSRHGWKRRVLNQVLGLLSPSRPGAKRVLTSYYYTQVPLFEALAAASSVEAVFYDWPGRRLFGMREWSRWRFQERPARSIHAEAGAEATGRILDVWRRLSASESYASRFTLEGLPVWPIVRARLDRVVKETLPFLAERVEELQRSLDGRKPDLVLVPYDANPPERILLYEARRRNVPSALVLHGVPCAPRVRFMDTQADHLLLGGSGLIAPYVETGVARERIHDVGLPLLDKLSSSAGRVRPPGPPRVLLLSNHLPIRENLIPVLDVLRRHPEVRITVKLHPGESLALYRRVLGSRIDERCELALDVPFQEALKRCHLVVGAPSTGLIEAMALGLPVVATNLQSILTIAPFDGKSGIEVCVDADSVEKALGALLPGNIPERVDYSKVLDAYAGKLDGKCVERCFSVLTSLTR